mgnify:CR=1 FL=1
MEKRKLKIALSLAVLIPCVLYIAGIIAQFMININAWKAAGSDYSVSPGLPSLELADVFRSILHFPEGLIAIGMVVVGIVLICIFGLRIGWGQNGVTDSDRNLTVSSSGSYGTASFMSPKEASACFDVTSAKKTEQDILGMLPDGQILTLPKNTRLNSNLAVCGSSGTGLLYGCMMGNYDGLYLPMMVLGYVFSVPFFLLTVRTSQKEGQKASLMKYVSVAFLCYIGVLVLLLLWGKSDAFTLSIMGENGLSINLYTILFIAFFGIGYGAYYATADMPIPMVADCSDYETYRSGNYIPGIMGTLFSLVDKLVSSLSATVVGIAVSFVGLESLPTQYDPYTPGMNRVVIVLFCIIPMVAWAATLIAMKGYSLTGEKMKEIQAVNACRRDAVANGMKLEDAMTKWQTLDQLPAEYRG